MEKAIKISRRGFTLIELLTVVGLMGLMGTLATGGYFAFQRGMSDRGAVAAATSLIQLAHDRARADLTPTVVYFYNERVKLADSATDEEASYAGVAIAVRRGGRVTDKRGDYLYDEFADLNRTYEPEDTSGSVDTTAPGFRLYRFNSSRMEYSVVYDACAARYINGETFCVVNPKNSATYQTVDNESRGDIPASAFRFKNVNGVDWKVGDAYGYAFAQVRLPNGYVFGTGGGLVGGDDPVVTAGAPNPVRCLPADAPSSLGTVTISALRTNGSYERVGNTKSDVKDL